VLVIGFMLVIGVRGTVFVMRIAFAIAIGLVIGMFRAVFRDFSL
jgi:hypothetical protein